MTIFIGLFNQPSRIWPRDLYKSKTIGYHDVINKQNKRGLSCEEQQTLAEVEL